MGLMAVYGHVVWVDGEQRSDEWRRNFIDDGGGVVIVGHWRIAYIREALSGCQLHVVHARRPVKSAGSCCGTHCLCRPHRPPMETVLFTAAASARTTQQIVSLWKPA